LRLIAKAILVPYNTMRIMETALLGARVLLSSAWELRAFSDGMR